MFINPVNDKSTVSLRSNIGLENAKTAQEPIE